MRRLPFIRIPVLAALGSLLLVTALAACADSAPTVSSSTPTLRATAAPTPTATSALPLHSIQGELLPGTTASGWTQLHRSPAPPSATEMEQASSHDLTYRIAFFSFSTQAGAATFFSSPPPAIRGFVPGALGYSTLAESTGVPAPSTTVDLRSCAGEGSGPSYVPASGMCSNGGASFSIGVAILIQRGNVVVFVAYMNAPTEPDPSPAGLIKIRPLAQDALSLLSTAGLGQ